MEHKSFLSDKNLWIVFINFLYFISAWIFVFCLLQFCSESINLLFPLLEWSDPIYSRSFQRGITAGLVISSIFVTIFSSVINFQYKKDKFWKENVVRKILIYIWLAVLFIVVIINLISTTVSFLNGNVSLNSPIRLVVVTFVSSIIYYFYLSEVREFKNYLTNYKLNIGAVLIVTASLCILSFKLFGGPITAQKEYSDQKLQEAVQNMRGYIDQYYSRNKTLPTNEEIILKIPLIAKTGNLEYKILSSDEYEICADFKTSNIENYSSNPNFIDDEYVFLHNLGRACKKFKAYISNDAKILPVQGIY